MIDTCVLTDEKPRIIKKNEERQRGKVRMCIEKAYTNMNERTHTSTCETKTLANIIIYEFVRIVRTSLRWNCFERWK